MFARRNDIFTRVPPPPFPTAVPPRRLPVDCSHSFVTAFLIQKLLPTFNPLPSSSPAHQKVLRRRHTEKRNWNGEEVIWKGIRATKKRRQHRHRRRWWWTRVHGVDFLRAIFRTRVNRNSLCDLIKARDTPTCEATTDRVGRSVDRGWDGGSRSGLFCKQIYTESEKQ